MVGQVARQTLSVDEWRVLEQTSPDLKHEYIDGHVYAMAGGSAAHSRVGINVVRELEDALAATGKPCYVYNSDMAVRLSSRRYTYPDATVTCEERDRPTGELMAVLAPHLVVEVLSAATEAYDRGTTFGYYRACPEDR